MTCHPTSQNMTVTSAPAAKQSTMSLRSNMAGTVPVMPWEVDENPPNFLGRDEAAAAITEIADQQPGEFLKAALKRAAKYIGFSFWRTSDIHYGKARRIETFEAEAIGAALDRKRREIARHELHELKTRIALLEARLAQIDPEFHRPSVDALGAAMRGAR